MSDEKKAGGYTLVEDEGWVLSETEPEPEAEEEAEEEDDLETYTKEELQELLAERDLPTSGNKPELIERLRG